MQSERKVIKSKEIEKKTKRIMRKKHIFIIQNFLTFRSGKKKKKRKNTLSKLLNSI